MTGRRTLLPTMLAAATGAVTWLATALPGIFVARLAARPSGALR
jgi:hypothetical protein